METEEEKKFEAQRKAATKELNKLNRKYGIAFESAVSRIILRNRQRRKLEKEIAKAKKDLEELERKKR